MRELNRAGYDQLVAQVGSDLSELRQACIRALEANKRREVIFDSHAGDNATVASLKELVERMGEATGRRIQWNDDHVADSMRHDPESSWLSKMPSIKTPRLGPLKKQKTERTRSVKYQVNMFKKLSFTGS
eukprot:3473311-Prymnesium_polylepis.2